MFGPADDDDAIVLPGDRGLHLLGVLSEQLGEGGLLTVLLGFGLLADRPLHDGLLLRRSLLLAGFLLLRYLGCLLLLEALPGPLVGFRAPDGATCVLSLGVAPQSSRQSGAFGAAGRASEGAMCLTWPSRKG